MIALILLVLAALCFFAAAINQTVVSQTPADLVAWGLCLWVVAILLGQPLVASRLDRGGE